MRRLGSLAMVAVGLVVLGFAASSATQVPLAEVGVQSVFVVHEIEVVTAQCLGPTGQAWGAEQSQSGFPSVSTSLQMLTSSYLPPTASSTARLGPAMPV